MNKLITSIAAKQAANALTEASEKLGALTEGEVVMSRKVFMLELAVAALGGLVLGMFLSPRKTCTYKIASCNRINSEENEDDEEYDDEDDYFDEDDSRNKSKFIKL